MNIAVTAVLGDTALCTPTLAAGAGEDPGPKPEPGFETRTSRLGLCCGACFGPSCSPLPSCCHSGQEASQEADQESVVTLGLSWVASHLPQGLMAPVSIQSGVWDDVEGKQASGVQQGFPIRASMAPVSELLTHSVSCATAMVTWGGRCCWPGWTSHWYGSRWSWGSCKGS